MSHPPAHAWPNSSPGTHGCSIPRVSQGCCLLAWSSASLWDVLPGCLGNGNPWQSKPHRAPPSRHCSGIRHLHPPAHREMADSRQSISVPHVLAKQDSSWDLLHLIFCLPSPQTQDPTGDLFYWLFIATVMASVFTNEHSTEFSILLLVMTAQKLAMGTRRKGGCSGRDGKQHPQCSQESPQWLRGWDPRVCLAVRGHPVAAGGCSFHPAAGWAGCPPGTGQTCPHSCHCCFWVTL